MRLILFGPFGGFASYPVVMRGLAHAFEQLGVEVLRADISGVEEGLDGRAVKALYNGSMPDGLDADVVFAMKPSITMSRLRDAGHKLVGLHVGDVSEIPVEWRLVMRKESLVVVPSQWMASVVENAMGPIVPIAVSNHGVEDVYLDHDVLEDPSESEFKWLHFCSSGVYPERKGTPQALAAFERLYNSGRSMTLTMVVSELRRPLKRLLGALGPGCRQQVQLRTRPYGIGPSEMIALYREHHALLAPSRAEGFGIQPLEARALGRPVVQTACTGFADHGVQEWLGVSIVEHGDLIPAWGDFGYAPEVTVEAVESAMKRMLDEYREFLCRAQQSVQSIERWSWVDTTQDLVVRLRSL